MIEKHFTLNQTLDGPDHKASVTPKELKRLVEQIRQVERYLGDGVKMPSCSEQMTRKSLQKYLVASRKIGKGQNFSGENVTAKRTDGAGISALYYDQIVGRTAARDFEPDDLIQLD